MRPEDLTIEMCEEAIGIKADNWHTRCHEIACLILASGIIEGDPCYGHYRGPVHPDSRWDGVAIQRHGWILLKDGRILDPTRFSFENKSPYLYLTEDTSEYDEGGNRLRIAMRQPCPKASETTRDLPKVTASDADKHLFEYLTETPFDDMSLEQFVWVANLGYDELDWAVGPIYQVLIDNKMGVFIPVDNRVRAAREGRIEGN